MYHKARFLVAFALAVVSVSAYAQTPGVQLNMDSGFYIGASAGKARMGENCVGTCDTTDKTWHAVAGYQFNRHWALEAGYSDFGEVTTSGAIVGVPITSLVETTAWELVAVGALPLSESFAFYGKLGLFNHESDFVTSGAFVGATSDDGTGFTGGLGVRYGFTPNLSAHFEWQTYSDVGAGGAGPRERRYWSVAPGRTLQVLSHPKRTSSHTAGTQMSATITAALPRSFARFESS